MVCPASQKVGCGFGRGLRFSEVRSFIPTASIEADYPVRTPFY